MRPDRERDGEVPDSEEEIVEEFMQGSPRAERLAELCGALRLRLRALRHEIQQTDDSAAREGLERRYEEAREQLAVLQQELAISQFVEDSVRVTYRNQSSIPEEEEEW